jgi:hypothetical protein
LTASFSSVVSLYKSLPTKIIPQKIKKRIKIRKNACEYELYSTAAAEQKSIAIQQRILMKGNS